MFALPTLTKPALTAHNFPTTPVKASDYVLVNVARLFALTPQQAGQYIQVQAGEWVTENTLLALYIPVQGIGTRRLYAPCAGTVSSVQGGKIVIVPFNRSVPIPKQAAPAKTGLRAVWATAHAPAQSPIQAEMAVLSTDRTAGLTASLCKPEHAGKILAVGGCLTVRGLQAAIRMGAAGVVAASMPAEWVKEMSQCPIPVAIIEGFGERVLTQADWMLMYYHNGKQISIAQDANGFTIVQIPAVLNPLQNQKETASVRLQAGMQVKLLNGSHGGGMGVLTEILTGLHTLPSGVKTRVARVRMMAGEQILVALNNLTICASDL
ncbi:MAG TPA: hypothetical protein PK299_05100 [Anaerolineales bacterium]|nr:hypothetical protein [Anaerolineales bacterium]